MNLRALLARCTPLPNRIAMTQCAGSSAAYCLAKLWGQALQRPWCIVTPTLEVAERFAADCRFYIPAHADRVVVFPPRDAAPFQTRPTAADTTAARLRALAEWITFDPAHPLLTVVPIASCLAPTLPPSTFRRYTRRLHRGDLLPGLASPPRAMWQTASGGRRETHRTLYFPFPSLLAKPCGSPPHRRCAAGSHSCDRESFVQWLTEAGYVTMPLVEDMGTMAVRGGIIDCWPATMSMPLRIELDGELVASLRTFDAATQRSQTPMENAWIGPAQEVVFTSETTARALAALRRRAADADLPVPTRRPVQEAVQQGRRIPLLETLLPWFYETVTTPSAYLPAETVMVAIEPAMVSAEAAVLQTATQASWEKAETIARLIRPDEVSVPMDDWMSGADVMTIPLPGESFAQLRAGIAPAQPGQDPLTPLAEFLRQAVEERYRVTIACHTPLAVDRTVDLFRWHGLTVNAVVGTLSSGFRWPEEQCLYLTEEELFGSKIAKRAPRRATAPAAFLSFQDLEPGDPVVHEQHGIGRFVGLKHLTIHNITNDFVLLEYLGGDKLYLPVYRLQLLQRYIGAADGMPTLDRLGGARWSKATTRAMQSVRVMANELLKIYAERKLKVGTAFSGRDHALEEFEAAFPYDETPDQWQAIEEMLKDMQSEQPMDRLICGDVGYGKTEVAMRAAFRAAMDGKQAAVLVPTTLLAFQHYETFQARFAGTAVRIEMLSRFRTREEQQRICGDLAKGAIDIIIGTHRLLQKDVVIPRLGLLVIDEEQRFGVAHKERLRKLKATVDTLTLTATPIPRTLHMALGGLRDISVIQTSPADRHAIRTHVVPFEDPLIREAILRELQRGGEVFFVHNRVQTIYGMRDHLQRIVPEARIVVAHGQMDEGELEAAMLQFVRKEANVLLCSSIIESGLDIPSANTILINRADTFGLAQLYQMRGRVGRSNVQATAYLFTPPDQQVATTAQRRLATLARYTELGSGFAIAMHDLEIRGAGNLLGAQQSGHIAEIGYEMFTRLLEQTIRRLRGEPETEEIDPEITLPIPAYLPEDYVADPNTRIVWYKRLSGLETTAELDAAAAELQDRFGPIPDAAHALLRIIAIKQAAKTARIDLIRYDQGTFIFRFHPSTSIDPQRLMAYVAKQKATHQLRPNGTLAIRQSCVSEAAIIVGALDHLRSFTTWMETR